MNLAPAIVTPELAAAALAAPLLADAIKLAEWVGDGKEVTEDGVLLPALQTQAREYLGIELPAGTVTDAVDSEALDGLWDAAFDAGFLAISDDVASAADLPTEPEEVLRSWLELALTPFGIPGEPCAECLTVLAVLADATEPVSVLTLAEEIMSDFPSGADEEDEEEDEVSSEIDEETLGHVIETLGGLHDLNAVGMTEFGDAEKDTVWLTPLGQMLATTAFSAITLAPEEMAGVVLYRFGQLTPRIAEKIAGPWLAARSTADAARELLDFAAYARADKRMIATAYVNKLGIDAGPAWRERVKDRGIGVYARAWLAEHGEKVSIDGRDLDWMQVEKLSAHLAVMPEPLRAALFAQIAAQDPDALPELRRTLNRSRHPDAPGMMEAIGQVTRRRAVMPRREPSPAPSTATGTVYRVRVSLRYVEDPDVWRLVAVDAGTTLADLHEIIQAAMGWGDDHLHGFSVGHADIDEAAPLGRLLRKPGDRLLYTYDFGDDWEHDVSVEDFHHNDSGATLPALLGGSGACPPEDCGGAPGYQRLKEIMADPDDQEYEEMSEWLGVKSLNPDDFSLADAAASVSRLGLDRSSQRSPVAVVRVQPKRKKRRH